MEEIRCKRCQTAFFTVSVSGAKVCPYCGFSFVIAGWRARAEERAEINRECSVTVGGRNLEAVAVDISPSGLGVRLKGLLAREPGQEVRVMVRHLLADASAKVVWSEESEGGWVRAGLRLVRA